MIEPTHTVTVSLAELADAVANTHIERWELGPLMLSTYTGREMRGMSLAVNDAGGYPFVSVGLTLQHSRMWGVIRVQSEIAYGWAVCFYFGQIDVVWP